MRFKKTIFFSFVVLVCFLTYLFFQNDKLIYVSLGDSLAAGQNPYGEIGYGYSDYIADYLKDSNQLALYVSSYAVSGYKAQDVVNDIEQNKSVEVDGKKYNIRSLLRESDVVTLSIGANDFLAGFTLDNLHLDDVSFYKEKVDSSLQEVDKALSAVTKYAKNKVIVVGYYNPFPILFSNYEKVLDEIFSYVDNSYQALCDKYSVSYESFYSIFKDNSNFLPNPFDIHPNINGYEKIANVVIEKYLKN